MTGYRITQFPPWGIIFQDMTLTLQMDEIIQFLSSDDNEPSDKLIKLLTKRKHSFILT